MRGMMKLTSALAMLALIAAPAAAQAGQGRGPGHDQRPAMGPGMMRGGPAAMARNPASVVLEHEDALELTADQVQALERVEARIEAENGPRLEQLRAAFGDADPMEMTVAERQALRDRMRELQPVRDAIRETNRAAMAEVHELLTDLQETALRGIMRRGPDGGPARGMRGPRGGDRVVGAAWRSGFRDGWQRGWHAARRMHRGGG